MELYGEKVKHKTFGRGQIIEFKDNYVKVLFEVSNAEKDFIYPSAFGGFLEIENKSLLGQIEEALSTFTQKEAEDKISNEERIQTEADIKAKENKRSSKSTSKKVSDTSNIAFKCNYCDGGKSEEIVGYKGICSDEAIRYNINTAKHIWCKQKENKCYKYLQGDISREEINRFYEETKTEFSKSVCYESQMLEIWVAGAGITQSGAKKGTPMSLKNARANSLALLTTKLPDDKDENRFIFAVFLIDENYEGDNMEEGYVGANPKYRIQLSLEEAKELKFWDYYFNPNKPEKIVFGSGLHRYLTDTQSAQVLSKICQIKKGTGEEELSKEFLEHYCTIKKLDINSIAMPEGALTRQIIGAASV
jgi:hypothetical protein